MKNLFERSSAEEIKARVQNLSPESERGWGKMSAAQMLAHCSEWMEMVSGLKTSPRNFVGRIVGSFAKKSVLYSEEPIRRNMPTDKIFLIQDERNFLKEQQRLLDCIDSFSAGGAEGCTKHPHSFFGPMTPDEWAIMGYKHLDHHLRQFGC
ncbi:MAG TPA: DUF1569 domain-containing protein [Edaphobacter sp.]|jgi:hypothetical protein|nr:DUF1569 domain-containing protein [Edaphobacter sp.]